MANGRLVVDRDRLQKAGAELINVIKSSKENFYIKTYWSIMKAFINGKKPLFCHHYWLITT